MSLKRILSLLVAIFLANTFICGAAVADYDVLDDYVYVLYSGDYDDDDIGEAELTYVGNAKKVTTPKTIVVEGKKYDVVQVSLGGENTEELTVSEGVRRFIMAGSQSLRKLVIPTTLEYIDLSFAEYPKLKDVRLSGADDENLQVRVYQNCIYNISELVFAPNDLETIELPAYAWVGDKWCFYHMLPNLKEIKVAEGNAQHKAIDGILYSYKLDELQFIPQKKAGPVKLPVGIKKSVFDDYPSGITEIHFPEGLKEFVFDYIPATKLHFSKSLEKIAVLCEYSADYLNSSGWFVDPNVTDVYFDGMKKDADIVDYWIDNIPYSNHYSGNNFIPIRNNDGTYRKKPNGKGLESFVNQVFPNAVVHYADDPVVPTPSATPAPSESVAPSTTPSPSESVKPSTTPKPSETITPSEPTTVTTRYSDVPTSGTWYSDAVYYATKKGYMAGTGNNKFTPSGTVTRGTIAQILYAAEGKPAVSGKSQFADVIETKWYAKAVKWAADKGIVSGYGNGRFGPDNAVTREQMIAIMYKYSQMKGYDLSASADISKFADRNQISKYAVNAIKWGVTHSVISGTKKGIEPKGKATRAQIAVILQAYDKNIRK